MVYYRTIKNGRVKILHQIYVPSSAILKYDGRLDGLRYVFWDNTRDDIVKMNMEMSELAWRLMLTPYFDLFMDGPEKVDGGYPWQDWYPER